jgi:aminopeptidase-like protein
MGDNSAELAVLWVLNFSDGDLSLLDIAARAGLPCAAVRAAADALLQVDLLADAPA